MTLVFGKLVNEFNRSDPTQADKLKPVVNKYAYQDLCHPNEYLSDPP